MATFESGFLVSAGTHWGPRRGLPGASLQGASPLIWVAACKDLWPYPCDSFLGEEQVPSFPGGDLEPTLVGGVEGALSMEGLLSHARLLCSSGGSSICSPRVREHSQKHTLPASCWLLCSSRRSSEVRAVSLHSVKTSCDICAYVEKDGCGERYS